jgi:hypothetical protein
MGTEYCHVLNSVYSESKTVEIDKSKSRLQIMKK